MKIMLLSQAHFDQGSKEIRQWTINLCTVHPLIMIQKINSSADQN